MADEKTPPPSVMWAQRYDFIYLTINLEDCENPEIELTNTKLSFKGSGGPDKSMHAVDVEFYSEIDTKASKYKVLPRHIAMALKRKEEGPYWPRLLKEKQKCHWLKTDFEKWKDEDESDDDDDDGGPGGKMDLNELMANMGNFNAELEGEEGKEDKGEVDSDDEELPDLE